MRLQVVSDEESQDIKTSHESNGIALHDPPEDESAETLEGVAVDVVDADTTADSADSADESSEPDPTTDTDPTSEPAIDPASNPSDDGISADEMPSREGVPTAMEEPAVGASRSSLWEEHVNAIRDQERSIAFAENEWNAAKEEAKIKKAAFDLAVSDLREVIRRGPNQPSLFGSPSQSATVTDSSPMLDGEPVHADDPAPVPTEATVRVNPEWRSLPIGMMGLSKTVAKRVAKLSKEHDITTIGQLDDWWEANGEGDKPLGFMLVDHARQVDEALRDLREAGFPCPTPSAIPSELTAPDDESWKSTPIVELEIVGLSKGIITKLLDAGINTVGELAAWSTEYRTLQDVPGLGEKKVEKVDQAMERFWAERSKP